MGCAAPGPFLHGYVPCCILVGLFKQMKHGIMQQDACCAASRSSACPCTSRGSTAADTPAHSLTAYLNTCCAELPSEEAKQHGSNNLTLKGAAMCWPIKYTFMQHATQNHLLQTLKREPVY